MPDPSTATGSVGPTLTTSIYETRFGLAALTWSRTALGLSLRADLRLPSSDSSFLSFSFRIRTWILWKRKGAKRFHLDDSNHHSTIDFAWDLARAKFPSSGGPEPLSGFFVAIAVDGEMFLVVGDAVSDAYKKMKTAKPVSGNRGSPANPILVSRSEHVVVSDSDRGRGRSYKTSARVGGKEREISISIGVDRGGREKDARLYVGFDGRTVLQVKRLGWKFRGNERVDSGESGGGKVTVSWDAHKWLFSDSNDSAQLGHAVLVFKFDRDEAEGQNGKISNNTPPWAACGSGHFGNIDRSGSYSFGSGGLIGGGRRKRSLLKTSSSSSASSSASSASGSSVMSWASAEENELKESDGFFLVVNIWKR